MRKIWMLVTTSLILGSLCVAGTARVTLSDINDTLPDIDTKALEQDAYSNGTTQIYDDSGNTVTDSFAIKQRYPVSYREIPPLVINAFIAAEDKNFWDHNGVDYPSIMRAAMANILHHRHEGGSGITQQVIKNLVIGNNQTIERKIKEALLAIRLEKEMSKQDIMGIYLNSIWFGHGAYGIGAASQAWFQKDVKDLTLPEIAFMAGLPRGPAIMEPSSHPDRALARRAYVLDNMVALGFITPDAALEAKTAPLPSPKTISNTGTGNSYYTETVRGQLISDKGSSSVYSGGMKISTYQNLDLQAHAEDAFASNLRKYDMRHGWRNDIYREHPSSWSTAIVKKCASDTCLVDLNGEEVSLANSQDGTPGYRISPGAHVLTDGKKVMEMPQTDGSVIVMDKNGHVLAMVGGFYRGASSFNRATQSLRQTGSVIKPFIALAAIENGWTPQTIVADVPITISVAGHDWSPGGDGRDDGMGLITLKEALAQSRNQAFVRLGQDIGFDNIFTEFKKMGLYDENASLSPASMLGASETSLIRMASGYASILANTGCPVSPHFIVEDPKPCDEQIIHDTTPLQDMLHDVVSDGTAKAAFRNFSEQDLKHVGGKTGTSNNVMDSWFIGYVDDYIVGVHVGNDTPSSLGEHEFGSTIAAPIAADIMKYILQTKKAPLTREPFPVL